MLKFLHTYKGKNANTVIDNRAYDATEAIRLIKEAKSAYDVRVGTANTILNAKSSLKSIHKVSSQMNAF